MKNGFTLIELIISIFILSIAVVGIFSAYSIMIILTADSADRLTATYLTQEGMEIIRNIRDQNWLNMDLCVTNANLPFCGSSGTGFWAAGLYDPTGAYGDVIDCSCSDVDQTNNDCSDKGCDADYTSGTSYVGSYPVTPWTGDYLCLNKTSGFYNNQDPSSNNVKTRFKRKIIINPITDVDGIPGDGLSYHILLVEVQVSWDEKATILNSYVPASDCEKSNCIKAEETLYDWYNYNQNQNQNAE